MLLQIVICYLLVGLYFDAVLLYVGYQRGYYSDPKDLWVWGMITTLIAGLLAWPAIVKVYIESDF